MTRRDELARKAASLREAALRARDPALRRLYLVHANTLAAKAARFENLTQSKGDHRSPLLSPSKEP